MKWKFHAMVFPITTTVHSDVVCSVLFTKNNASCYQIDFTIYLWVMTCSLGNTGMCSRCFHTVYLLSDSFTLFYLLLEVLLTCCSVSSAGQMCESVAGGRWWNARQICAGANHSAPEALADRVSCGCRCPTRSPGNQSREVNGLQEASRSVASESRLTLPLCRHLWDFPFLCHSSDLLLFTSTWNYFFLLCTLLRTLRVKAVRCPPGSVVAASRFRNKQETGLQGPEVFLCDHSVYQQLRLIGLKKWVFWPAD